MTQKTLINGLSRRINRSMLAIAVLLAITLGVTAAAQSRAANRSAPIALYTGGFGKHGPLASAEVFESKGDSTGSFVATDPMHHARGDHSATLLQNGQVLIAGGAASTSIGAKVFSTAELYSLVKRRFSMTGNLITARTRHTATLLGDGKVLIAGGNDGTQSISSAELYDPATGTFSATGSLITTRESCSAILLHDGKVLIAGGGLLTPGNGVVLNTAELYDPATATFSATGSMSDSRLRFAATPLPNGQVLISGGSDNDGTVLATTELYDPPTQQFIPSGQMTASRYGHIAAPLGDGDVLIAGGIDNSGSSLASAELFLAESGTFEMLPPMKHDRFFVGATVLTDTEILIAGGYTQCLSSSASFCSKPVKSALIFDHASNTIRAAPSMTTARGSFASAPLVGSASSTSP